MGTAQPVLAEVESTLEENNQLQIWLVPMVPEEAPASPSEPVVT